MSPVTDPLLCPVRRTKSPVRQNEGETQDGTWGQQEEEAKTSETKSWTTWTKDLTWEVDVDGKEEEGKDRQARDVLTGGRES